MKAILKLISSKAQAAVAAQICAHNELIIVHRKHGFALDENMIALQKISLDLGGYGTSFSIAFDQRFKNSWALAHARKRTPNIYSSASSLREWDRISIDYDEKPNKAFFGLRFFFSDEKSSALFERDIKWIEPLPELKNEIEKLGGECVDSIKHANVVVTLSERVAISSEENLLVVSQDILRNVLPAKKEASLIKDNLSQEAKKIWKLLNSRDYLSIHQGLKIAETLPDKIDELVSGCYCSDSGELEKSSRFSGTKTAEAYLDYALLGLLSFSGDTSRSTQIRRSIKILNLYLKELPFMRGFDSLENLSIELPRNNSKPLKNLTTFGTFLNLKKLKVFTSGWGQNVLESLDGLVAPHLEELSAASLGLQDITALNICRNLREIDLSRNSELRDAGALASSADTIEKMNLSDCDKLESIHFMSGAIKLKQIKLNGCNKIESLKALGESRRLDEISVDGSRLSSLEGLEHIILRNVEVRYVFKLRDPAMLKQFINLLPSIDDPNFNISELIIQRD